MLGWQHEHNQHFPCLGSTVILPGCRALGSKLQSNREKNPLCSMSALEPLHRRCEGFTVSVALTLIATLCLIQGDKTCETRTTRELFVKGLGVVGLWVWLFLCFRGLYPLDCSVSLISSKNRGKEIS